MSEIKVGDRIKPYGWVLRHGEDIYIFCNGKRTAVVNYCLPTGYPEAPDDVIIFTFEDGDIKYKWKAHRKQCRKLVKVKWKKCDACNGETTRYDPEVTSTLRRRCQKCNGKGKVKV